MRLRPGLWSGVCAAIESSRQRRSDDEVGAIRSLGRPAVKTSGARALANILDGDFVELLHHLFLQRCDQRHHNPAAKLGTAIEILLVFVQAHGDAHDIAHADAPALPRKAIAAARAADALQNSGANKLLHDLFEVALRHTLARGDLFGLHRFGPCVVGNVDHRFEGEQGLTGKTEHSSLSDRRGRWNRSPRLRARWIPGWLSRSTQPGREAPPQAARSSCRARW